MTLRRLAIASVTLLLAVGLPTVGSARTALRFSNTPLLTADGNSEPAIAIASNGTMALTGLSWQQYQTNLWTGTFGSTPTFQGGIDTGLQQTGKRVFGGGDADVDLGSTGTLHASTLIFLVNPTQTSSSLGVSAITCPRATSAGFSTAQCTKEIPTPETLTYCRTSGARTSH